MSNKLKTILQKEINPTKTVAIFSVLFLTLSLVYYFTIFLPEEEAKFVLQEARIESELQLQKFKEKQEELRKAELEISTLEKGHLFDDALDNDVENEDWFENRPDQTREEDERLRAEQDYQTFQEEYQNYLRNFQDYKGEIRTYASPPDPVEELSKDIKKMERERKEAEKEVENSLREMCRETGGYWMGNKCDYPLFNSKRTY